MSKKIIAFLTVMGVALVLSPAWAMPNLGAATLSTSGTSRTLVLPPAAAHSPVISLGTAVDPQTGKMVEGYAFIHPEKSFAHWDNHAKGGKGGAKGGGKQCFSFLAKGAKWRTVEPWVMNSSNSAGLDESFVFNNLSFDIAKWEDAADGAIDNIQGADILGDGSNVTDLLVADTVSPDGINEVYFADVSSSGAIAVTIVWGIFSGPPFLRELVEWDQVYDDVDFGWSATGEAGKMDFENIVTHELGHSVGLGHPDDSCLEETMYRYADFGEIKKRSLEAGDIAGVSELY